MAELDSVCYQCGLWKRGGALCPNMPPSGSEKPLIYVVGMAPGREEDVVGKQFVGRAGKFLREALKKSRIQVEKIRWYNTVNCIPPDNAPKEDEIRWCSQRVREDIERTQPRIVLALGGVALKGLWPELHGDAQQISRVRGAIIPYGDNGTWAIPTYHPSYVMRGVPEEEEQCWMRDLVLVRDCSTNHELESRQSFRRKPEEIVMVKTLEKCKELFSRLASESVVAWDWETTTLLPWELRKSKRKPALFSAAFAFSESVYAMPLLNSWRPKDLEVILASLGKWFVESNPKQRRIAHNLKFELEWGLEHCVKRYKRDAKSVDFVGDYHDTQLMAWVLEGGIGQSKLKVAAWRWLGIQNWSIDVTDIVKLNESIEKKLEYNAWDAWWTFQLDRYFSSVFKIEPGLRVLYEDVKLPAVWSFLGMETRGIQIDQEVLAQLEMEFSERQNNLIKEIRDEVGLETTIDNLMSSQQLADYFFGKKGYSVVSLTPKGKRSVDAVVLETLVEKYRDPVASGILQLREMTKLVSTYLTGMRKLIYVDGKIRPSYMIAGPETGRTSASGPNIQQFPKRRHKEVRNIVGTQSGSNVFSFDMGQIEARCFGMTAADPTYLEALWKDYDIHYEAALELYGDERTAKERRSGVKNSNFALLYGAGNRRIAETLGESLEVAEKLRRYITEKFPEFRRWQNRVAKFASENGYVETLFGVRRKMPLTYTQILNTPIQGTATDMVLVAMELLSRKMELLWFIHDDMSYIGRSIPTVEESEDVRLVAKTMLSVPYVYMASSRWFAEWVPLQVEFSAGSKWGEMKPVRTWSSFDFGMDSLETTLDVAGEVMERLGRIPLKRVKW